MVRNQRVKRAVFSTIARAVTNSYQQIAKPYLVIAIGKGGDLPKCQGDFEKRSTDYKLLPSVSSLLLLLLGGRRCPIKNDTDSSVVEPRHGSFFRGKRNPPKQDHSQADSDGSQGTTKHTVTTQEDENDHDDRHPIPDQSLLQDEPLPQEEPVPQEELLRQVDVSFDSSVEMEKLRAFYRQQVKDDLMRAMAQMKQNQMEVEVQTHSQWEGQHVKQWSINSSLLSVEQEDINAEEFNVRAPCCAQL